MTDDDQDQQAYASALDTAADLLGTRLEPFLEAAPGEPPAATDFKRLATTHTFGDAWPRTQALDTPTRALISVTIAATRTQAGAQVGVLRGGRRGLRLCARGLARRVA